MPWKEEYCAKHDVCRGQPRCLPWYRRWWAWIDEWLWIWRLALKKRLGL